MSGYKVRILHISDVHLRGQREREAWRRQEVLGPAWDENLDELVAEGGIDLVCVTGDIANTGQADEYAEATEFFGALCRRIGIDKQRIFVVPGNHDIDRKVSIAAWRALRKHLPKTDPLDISRWLAGGACPSVQGLRNEYRAAVMLRQQAFHEWLRSSLGRPELLPENSPHKLLGYRSTFRLPERPFDIHILGLDSAWLAGDDKDAENLRLTEDQIMRLGTDAGKPLLGLRLALMHHPLHNLADHSDCQRRISKHVDLCLRGHLHEQDAVIEIRPDQELLQLAAGCLYEGSRANAYKNFCQLIELTVDRTGRLQQIALRLRSWAASAQYWHDDSGLSKHAPQGRLYWVRQTGADSDPWVVAPPKPLAAPTPRAAIPARPAGVDRTSPESLLDGMRTLAAGPQVRKFLATYLGTPERPEPFGGRTKELAALTAWLNRAEPPCLVLAAPAGRGKSMLLCRFCAELLPRSDLVILFFPISIRYQTNLEGSCIPAIVSRLCHVHDEPAPRLDHTSLGQWRILLDQYLCRPLPDGKTLLLIVDGLDEAGDWQADRSLFPARLPAGVRIVVSARYRIGETDPHGWRHRLGWGSPMLSDGLVLSGLDVSGVAEALSSLGMPLDQLAARSEIVVQIHRLSRGEPLLVQLWCHRLWQQGALSLALTPEQLLGYPAGLQGYMQEFWESRKQTEKAALRGQSDAQLVLEILASALGPLSQDELLALAPELGSLAALRNALEPLSRFVIGDGKGQGYVLSHSLLRDYFREEEMTESGRQEREQRFLSYGQQTLARLANGSLSSDKVPAYVLRYYGSHLQNCDGSPDLRLELVTNAWRKAWDTVENGAGGFLYDVHRAWDAVCTEDAQRVKQGESPRRLAAIARCAMCVASVRSIFDGIYSTLPQLLVELGVWSSGQAFSYVQHMSGEAPHSDRRSIVQFLLPRLPDELLPRALDFLLDQANSKWGSVDELILLTERTARACPHEAIATARGIRSETPRSQVLVALARHLPQDSAAPLVAEALQLARACVRPCSRSSWLEILAQYLTDSQRQDVLLESAAAAAQEEDAQQRSSRWRSLIPLLPKRARIRSTALNDLFALAGQSNPERTELPLALEVLAGFPLPTQRRMLREVSQLPHGKAAVVYWALDACRVHTIGAPWPDPKERWRKLQQLVGADEFAAIIQPSIDQLHSEESWRALDIVTGFAPFLSTAQKEAVVALLCTAPNPWLAARGLCALAQYLEPQWRLEALSRLLSLDWSANYSGDRDLLMIVVALADDQLDAAAELASQAKCPKGQAWAYYMIALRHELSHRPALLRQARVAALQIASLKCRTELQRKILSHYPQQELFELLDELYQAAMEISSVYNRIYELCRVASGLMQPFCDAFLRVALNQVPLLEHNYRAAAVLEGILKCRGISPELQGQVHAEALRAARSSRSASARALDLTDLSSFAPLAEQTAMLLEALDASKRLDDRLIQIMTVAALQPEMVVQTRLIGLLEDFEPEERLRALYYGLWPHVDLSLRNDIALAGVAASRALAHDNLGRVSSRLNWLLRLPIGERRALAQEVLAEARHLLQEHHDFLWNPSPASDADNELSTLQRELARVLQYTLPLLIGELDSESVLALSKLVPPTWTGTHAAVWHQVPAPYKSELIQQAFFHARALPDRERGLALAEIAANLDSPQREAGVQEALATAEMTYTSKTAYYGDREQVMRRVAPYLESQHLPVFNKLLVEIYEQANSSFMSLGTLLGAVPAALQSVVVENLLAKMAAWPPHIQERLLVACADHLSVDWHDRVAAVLPRLVDQWTHRPLAALVAKLSDRLLRQVLAATITANGDLAPTDSQVQALTMVGTELLRRIPSSGSEVVPVVMIMLQRRVETRPALLQTLEHMAPLLRLLVGQAGMTEIAETILEVGTWWL